MNKALRFLKKEFFEMLPPTIFFLLVFHLVLLVRMLLVDQYGIPVASSVSATIGALLVGKAILIADSTPLFHLFREQRLIYNVLWRVALYVVMITFFQVLEELVPLVSKHDSVSLALDAMMDEVNWPHFWAVHIFLSASLTTYSFVTGISEAIGHSKLWSLLVSKGEPKASIPS